MIYAARFEVMNELLGFLTENCCGGAAGDLSCGCLRARARTKRQNCLTEKESEP